MARVTGSLTHHVLCGRLWDITRQRYPSMHTKRIRKQSRFGPGSRSPARDPAVWSVHPELRCTLRGCGHGKACQTFKGCILCNGHNVPDAVVQGRRVTDRTLCGRCEAIAGQLYKQLGEETPRNDIDLRARLSDSGLRQGKVIPYRRSEARVDALLDALCPSLSKHTCTADGAWVDRERKEETPEDLHHARTLMNTCTDILHMEEDRISAWLISGASEDPSLEAVSALVCQGICSHSEPGGEAKPEL